MKMPFTTSQFLDVFRRYNQAVWPAQWLLIALALLATVLAILGTARASRAATTILAAFWIWMGVAYHLLFFASINRAAIAFGVLFIIEGLMLLRLGFGTQHINFRARWNLDGAAGLLFILYALVVYPAVGLALGRQYPAAPTFGLPCPTTIFTFGLLLWVEGKTPVRLLVIPAVWTLLGFTAARSMGIVEDYGLLITGVTGTAMILYRDRHSLARRERPVRQLVHGTPPPR
jgi:hypothetical protein